MSGVFVRGLGSDFERLHPMMQKRFGLSVEDGIACVGRGVMDEVVRGPAWAMPFLRFGAWRHILIPVAGTNIPFTIENYPYIDGFGRETISFVRTFELPGRRARFDASMVHDPERDVVVDYLGTHQHLAADLSFEVDDAGGLTLRSHEQRFYEGPVAFRFPQVLTGSAYLRESYDDELECYRIDVQVINPRFGTLFRYHGRFTCSWITIGEMGVPASVLPLREEMRP